MWDFTRKNWKTNIAFQGGRTTSLRTFREYVRAPQGAWLCDSRSEFHACNELDSLDSSRLSSPKAKQLPPEVQWSLGGQLV